MAAIHLIRIAAAAAAMLGSLATSVPAALAGGGAVRCTISTSSLRFGTYVSFAAADTRANAAPVYSCSAATPITIALNRGRSGSYAVRQMTQGPHALRYNLFLDPGTTTVWGDGSGGSHFYRNTAPPQRSVSVPVFGRIPAHQSGVPVGVYTDTIVVTVIF